MKNKQLIIIGGGASIKEGIKKDLWKRLKNKFVCGINYSYRYFDSTYLCCMNYTDFYDTNRKELKQLPLVLIPSRPHPSIYEANTLAIYSTSDYRLSGIFALDVGLHLLDEGEVFLLGYDYGTINNKTHFYQGQIEHRGIGKSQYYNRPGHAERDFEIFKQGKKVRIYNVSLDSKITTFPKISYEEFFKKLNDKSYDQKKLVKSIRQKLDKVSC